jgi:NAD-dependent deacetylase
MWVLTQNVDGFHGDSGSKNVIEIHGNLRHLRCTRCDHAETVRDYAHLDLPPRCPRCEAILRPEVVLFGEMLPPGALRALEQELRRGFDLVLSIGTSSLFPYIAQPVILARMQGVPTVEINPGVTPVSDACDYRVRAGAVATLEALLAAIERRAGDEETS